MKKNLRITFLSLTAFFSLHANAQISNKDFGIWQTFTMPLSPSKYPEVRGRLCNFDWKDIQTSPDAWNWSFFDQEISSRTSDDLPVIFMVYTGEAAPDWLYNKGVPKVILKDNKGNITSTCPYYADADYKYYFKNMISKVHQHIENLPASVRNNIVGVQGCFGSTGDYISYNGDDVPSQYNLSREEFFALFQEFSGYYYNEYKNTNPKIRLLSNPHNNGETQTRWLLQNCPGGWIKTGNIGKAYQLNDELDKAKWLYNILNQRQGEDFMRARSEITNTEETAWWKKAPYKNLFALLCYGIYWGLDWSNQISTNITNNQFDSALSFFNKYAGQKNPAMSTNAMCALKDGLDAADGTRFPSSKYGNITRNNSARYKNIANEYARYGVLLQDIQAAMADEMGNRKATGFNDVGWRTFPGNYERFLYQLMPNQTSAGYWNIESDDHNTMYGRFARGFDVEKNKKALYFDIDDAFFNDRGLNGKYPVIIEVTYLDNGGGSFEFYYDSNGSSDKRATQITCGYSNTWKKATIKLSDAYFNNRGQNQSDFSIRSANNKNVLFAVVELSRPNNFERIQSNSFVMDNIQASDSQAAISNPGSGNKKVIIYPNPSKEFFSLAFSDNSAITNIVVYNQEGRPVLQKQTTGSKIFILKSEIDNRAGVYYVKVFNNKSFQTVKVIVL